MDTRRHQMFPVLEPMEIERVRRFGKIRSYGAGEALAKVGEKGHGLTVILAGTVDITQHDESGRRDPIVTYGSGAFMGELAQLAGRPALVDAYAQTAVDALIIPPEQLRALLIAEAELGERIMRALILRRVGLLERGRGPVIVGRAENGDVLRLQSFLRRNVTCRRSIQVIRRRRQIERFPVIRSCPLSWREGLCAIRARTFRPMYRPLGRSEPRATWPLWGRAGGGGVYSVGRAPSRLDCRTASGWPASKTAKLTASARRHSGSCPQSGAQVGWQSMRWLASGSKPSNRAALS
jgi:CRP-like cAMP-binding protein